MNQYEEFTLKEHIIDFFNQNAEYFNDPQSEEKVFATYRFRSNGELLPSGDGGEFPEFADTSVKMNKPFPLVFTEKIELPVMENPKYFFCFFRNERLRILFDACPESAAKLGTRPWKYILRYSPEFVSQCPCLKKFSAEEKALILHHQKQLAQYL